MTDCINLGICGAKRALELIEHGTLSGAILTAVCEPDSKVALECAPELREQGIILHRSFSDLLADSRLDALLIAGPPAERGVRSIKALRAGLHVLCEPPAVTTPDEAYRLERAVRESGKVYALAEYRCFSPELLLARGLVTKGAIGDVCFADAVSLDLMTAVKPLSERAKAPATDSPIPAALRSSETIGPMLYTTGFRAVRAIGIASKPRASGLHEVNRPGAYVCQFELTSGAVGRSLHGKLGVPGTAYLTLHGDRGSIEVFRGRVMLHDYTSGRRVSTLHRGGRITLPGMREHLTLRDYSESLAIASFAQRILVFKPGCIEVHRALDMSLPGLYADRSSSDTSLIPDLRRDEGRKLCRGDMKSPVPGAEERYRLLMRG